MPGVDPDHIDAIAGHLGDIYREAELALVRDVADHLARHPGAPTAYADGRLAGVRALRRSVEAIVAGLEADGSAALREAVATGYRLGHGAALADIPRRWFARSGIGEAAAAAAEEVPQVAAVESLAAALVRDVGAVTSNILRDVLDAYREAGAGAVARMLTTGQTRRQASAGMWANLVRRGITGFTDRGGRRWRLSTYVEMAVRTSTARAATQGQTDRLDALGIGLVYVSDHGQECPLCAVFEGRVLRLAPGPTGEVTVPHALTGEPVVVEVVDTLAGARARGLHHPNCRHSISAYLPGVTRVPEPDNDPQQYEQRMEQRHRERRIREAREEEAAALTEEDRTAARRKVRARQESLRDHLDEFPYLKRLRYREQLGAGSTPRRGNTGDAVTPIGPDVEQTLDGQGAPFPTSARPPDTGPAPAEAPATAPAEGQLTLDDAQPDAPDPATMTDADIETELAELMAAGEYDSARMGALTEEMDRRDRAGTDPAEPPAHEIRLADLTEDELAQRLGDAFAEEDYDAAADIEAELDRRAAAEATPEPAEPPAQTLTSADLVWYDERRLATMLATATAEGRTRDAAVIAAELDHRAQLAEAPPITDERAEPETDAERRRREREDAEYEEMRRLVEEEGYELEQAAAEAQGRTVEALRREAYVAEHRSASDRRSFTEIAREQYKLDVARRIVQAEDECRGFLVTPAGVAAGIDPESLFSGPRSRAEKWASEELKNWWDEHGRLTFEDFVEQIESGRGVDGGRDYNR